MQVNALAPMRLMRALVRCTYWGGPADLLMRGGCVGLD